MIVENVGGAGGTIGTLRAAKMTPDGYTIVQTGVGQNAVAHGLDPKLGYDSMRDFIHIAQVHTGPNRAGGAPEHAVQDLPGTGRLRAQEPGQAELRLHARRIGPHGDGAVEAARQRMPQGADRLQRLLHRRHPVPRRRADDAGHAGRPDPDDVHQPGRGAAARRPASCARSPVSSLQRNPLYPDVPTIAESGFPGFQALSWSGMSADQGHATAIVDKFEAAMKKIMTSAEIKQKLEAVGFVVPPPGAAAYAAVRQERDRSVDQGHQDRRHQT